jgi:hypothetical protein
MIKNGRSTTAQHKFAGITIVCSRGHSFGVPRSREQPEATLGPKGAQADHSAISGIRTDCNKLVRLNSVLWAHKVPIM